MQQSTDPVGSTLRKGGCGIVVKLDGCMQSSDWTMRQCKKFEKGDHSSERRVVSW